MKMKIWICSLIAVLSGLAGCSNNDEPTMGEQTENTRGESDNNIYFYDGVISLEDSDGKLIYSINGPMMYPKAQGYVIPIPLLSCSFTSVVEINLGDNTLIEENSVSYYDGEVEKIESLPSDGEKVYSECLTIERVDADIIKVKADDLCWDKPVRILTKSISCI